MEIIYTRKKKFFFFVKVNAAQLINEFFVTEVGAQSFAYNVEKISSYAAADTIISQFVVQLSRNW